MAEADIGAVRLHYQFNGPGQGPVLVLAHSLGTDLTMWDGVVERLTPRWRILRFDARGHGRSSVPPGPCTVADLAQDLLALLDTLAIERVHLAGVSLGGMVGMHLGIHAPQRLGHLVLINTAARIGTREGWNARIQEALHDGMGSVANGAAERWFTPGFRQANAPLIARLQAALAASSAQGYAAACAAIRDMDLTPDLGRIAAPTLIVAGTHDAVTPPAESRILEQSIPHGRYAELPAAHLSPVELPDALSRSILAFLAEELPHG